MIEDLDLKNTKYFYSKIQEDFENAKKSYPQKFPRYFYGSYISKMAEKDKDLLLKDKKNLHHLILSVPARKNPELKKDIQGLILDLNIFFSKFRNTKSL